MERTDSLWRNRPSSGDEAQGREDPGSLPSLPLEVDLFRYREEGRW